MSEHGTMAHSDDTSAVSQAADERAFTALIEQHRRELQIHCYRMLASFDDAEDAVQDTFLRAWRYRESRNPGAALRSWLYQIATNACLDVIARDKRRAAVTVNGALQRARATLRKHLPSRKAEWPSGVDASAAERELVRRLVEASEQGDTEWFASVIKEDAVFRMPPEPGETVGRDAISACGWRADLAPPCASSA